MNHWIDRMHAIAAGMLFNGGYVVDRTPRGGGQPRERVAPVAAGEQDAAQTSAAARPAQRPSSRLATN